MISTNVRKRAVATRQAYLAMLDLKKLVDEATRRTHAAELEAIHSAVRWQSRTRTAEDLRAAIDRLRSPSLESALSQARERLEAAAVIAEQSPDTDNSIDLELFS